MNIRLNGQPADIQAVVLTDVLTHLGITPDRKGVAVAVNGTVVPRSGWDTAAVNPGDEVELIGAVQGG